MLCGLILRKIIKFIASYEFSPSLFFLFFFYWLVCYIFIIVIIVPRKHLIFAGFSSFSAGTGPVEPLLIHATSQTPTEAGTTPAVSDDVQRKRDTTGVMYPILSYPILSILSIPHLLY
ncbi:unnamed protein product [Diplocarpon coronariae]